MGSISQIPRLFQPLKVGNITLKHRVVLAPLTRYRADSSHTHTDLAVQYYGQRASTPGTLLITEGTFISPRASGYEHAPGIYSREQIAAWKRVTDEVHSKGSFIFVQLWSLGRAANGKILKSEGPYDVVSASDIPLKDGEHEVPRALTVDEIKQYVEDFRQAALNAIEAGFDGIEIHNANGYLPDQFIQSVSNNRTDEYGGSIENRARFSLEIVDAIVNAIGAERTAIRISPYNTFQDMGMEDPVPQFTYLIKNLPSNLAYLHVVESRVSGNIDIDGTAKIEPFQAAWGYDKVFIRAGGYTPESAVTQVERKESENTAIAMGRQFISNPDLPRRIKQGVKLTPYDRSLFYNMTEAHGYIDYTDATPVA